MEATDVLADAFGRIRDLVHAAAEDLAPGDLLVRPGDDANPIGWLLWHLTRVQDHHVTEVAGGTQLWLTGGWSAATGVPEDPDDTGYGHSSEQVAMVRPASAAEVVAYHDAVADRTLAYLATLAPEDLDQIVDRSYDPPVTLGVRLTSVVDDSLQHVGQAHYVRGLLAGPA